MKESIKNLLLLAVVGAALFITLNKPTEQAAPLSAFPAVTARPAAAPTPAPLDAYRSRRNQERAREQAALQAILEDGGASREEQARAREQLLALNENAEIELAVEAALASLGGGLCVARAGEITVLVRQALTEAQAALILELAQAASGLPREHVRIAVL